MIMKEKNDLLEQRIKEDLENEAQELREMLADFEEGELSPEKKAGMKEELHRRIEEYEVRKVVEQLPKKYQEAMKAGLKVMNDDTEFSEEIGIVTEKETSGEKKVIYKRKRLRVYAALAAVLVMAMALGINSFGGAERVLEIVKRAVGGREVVKVNTDEGNLILEKESEEEAYQKIRDELGIEPVKIAIHIPGFKFVSAEINPEAQMAELLYKCKGETVVYCMGAAHGDSSWGIDVEDEVTERYTQNVKDISVEIKEYETPDTDVKRYSANFSHQNVDYFMMGTVEKEDFEKIIKNLYILM